MMRFRVGRTAVRVHPLLPVLWTASVLCGGGAAAAGGMAALLIHEMGHLLAARCFSVPVLEIEVSPIGSLITLDSPEVLPTFQGAALALAGPLFSLLSCLFADRLLITGVDFLFVRSLARGGMLLFLVNLLPVLPLDGGCAMRALLSRFLPWSRASRILTHLAYVPATGLCGITLYAALRGEVLLSPAFAGLYLMYAAAQEDKQASARYVTALIGRRLKMEGSRALRVETLAVGPGMPVNRLLPCLSPGRYHRLLVTEADGMRPAAEMNEDEICRMILDHPAETVGACIKKDR